MTSSKAQSAKVNTPEPEGEGALVKGASTAVETSHGRTTITDTVVQKIAGISARQVTGVHNLGGGTARALGAVRQRIPGARASLGQGVSVEVGEKQAAVDLQIVIDYGVEIRDLTGEVRGNVITNIEQMTGLEVVEVNITVEDVFIPSEGEGEYEGGAVAGSRVQ